LNLNRFQFKYLEFMPVVPHCSPRCQDLQAVQTFVADCLEQVAQGQDPLVASLGFAIPAIDPLLALAHLSDPKERHLYLERATTQEAVVAFGSALVHQSTGVGRFNDAHRFVEQWMRKIHCYRGDDPTAAPPSPRFFCSFTFFPHRASDNPDFPAATVVLPQWQISRQGKTCLLTANFLLTPETGLMAILDELESRLLALERLYQQYPAAYANSPSLPLSNLTRRPPCQASQHFKASVERALSDIDRHQIQKIVLAHAFDVVRQVPFQTLPSLAHLRQRYPDCYVFSVANGRGKTFMGASPERLLSIAQRQLITDALAGSAPRGSTPQADRQLARRLLNSPKEQGEHQIVVNFLVQTLADLGLRPHYPQIPTLLRLSNIQHLHTPIQARLSGHIHPLQLVEALHPTPAVAGVPTWAACQQIHNYEQFDRGLYAAPLGWVGVNGDSEFIVGIRSALISGNWARLYAGAGIVAGSDPEREWAEINLKFRALGDSLV
jgi:menaquinone-specific isochorismate synthase